MVLDFIKNRNWGLLVLCLAFLFPASLPSYAQQLKTVHGTVVDESGEPVIGCAVYSPDNVKGGVATNVDGVFLIKLSEEVASLTFEALGFEKVTLPVDKVRRVRLRQSVQSIDEVVVTGIFTRKKDSFTGAVQTISSEDIKRVSNANVVQALKNLDPSLLIMDNLEAGSNPNAMASMQLRGASSLMTETSGLKSNFLNKGNTPLFVLDGFETSLEKITDMYMNRIQSITILKDASAKAIYGSKGANGVIVIETKALANERTMVTYTGNLTIEAPDLTSYNICNALEKLEVERREGFYDSPLTTTDVIIAQRVYEMRLKKALEGESTYWLSKPLRLGIGHKHSLEVELGNKDLKALATVSYNDVQGAMKGSYRDVISGDVNVSYRKNSWVFRNIMSFAYMKSEESPWGTFDEYARLNPYYNPYDEEGNLRKILADTRVSPDGINYVSLGGKMVTNPMWNATLNTTYSSDYVDFTDNLYAEYFLRDFLKLVVRAGVESKRTESHTFKPAEHTDFTDFPDLNKRERSGIYDLTNGQQTTFSSDVSAQFNKSFAGKHDVFATAQYNISQMKYYESTIYTEGYPNSNMTSIGFARDWNTDKLPTSYDGINRNMGALLTAGYTYANRYMADATFKMSGSSVFGSKRRWGSFWSAGVAWNIHNEAFLKNASDSWLRQLKLRYSIGTSGNQNFASNVALAVYRYASDRYFNGFAAAALDNMENPGLGWEQKMDNNFGLDLRTRRISATIDLYVSDTRNMVFSRSIVPSTGFTSVSDNLGKVRNRGIEASLSYTLWQKGSNYISIFGKAALNDNRLLEISDALRTFNETQRYNARTNGLTAPVVQYYDGMPLHSIWVVRSLGIDPTDGNEVYIDRNGNMTKTWNPLDLYNAGSSDPIINGNAGISGEIKGIGFSAIVTYRAGGYLYNRTLLDKVEGADISYNVDRRVYDGRWYQEGISAPYRKAFYNDVVTTQATSRFVQKNNILNLSSVSLYYEFPTSLVRKLRMDRLRATFYVNDIYTFSTIEIERGTSYPYARSFSFSVTATF